MKLYPIHILFLIALFAISISASGCEVIESQSKSDFSDSTKIIVSILPQVEFVEAVGGEYVDVRALIPPGASPATYEPKPSDLMAIEKAELYFQNGHLPFEHSHTQRIKSLNSDLDIVDTSQNVTLRYFDEEEHHDHDPSPEEASDAHDNHEVDTDADTSSHGSVDQHYWLSPLQVKEQLFLIQQKLSEHDPERSVYYQEQAAQYKKELDELHEAFRSQLGNLSSRTFLVFHPSLGYIARDYNLTQVAIEHDGKDPTIAQLQETIQIAEEENISVIFVQEQFNQNIARSVAEQIDAQVVTLNPLARNYLENMYTIAAQLEQGLGE